MNNKPTILQVLLGLLLLTPMVAIPAQEAKGRIKMAREAMQQWVQTQRLISQERRDWVLGKEMLLNRIALIRTEIRSLETKIGRAESSIAAAGKQKGGLRAEADRLSAASKKLRDLIAPLEARCRQLLVRLPTPLRDKVQPISQQLPRDPGKTELGMGARFQFVVGILNEVNKFNREIHVVSELRQLSNGRKAEVATLYVGVSKAFYVSPDGKFAGVGDPSSKGWVWVADDGAATQIAAAVAMFRSERLAGFVRLPVQIRDLKEPK